MMKVKEAYFARQCGKKIMRNRRFCAMFALARLMLVSIRAQAMTVVDVALGAYNNDLARIEMKRIIAASVMGAVLFGAPLAFAAEKAAQDASGASPAKTQAATPVKKDGATAPLDVKTPPAVKPAPESAKDAKAPAGNAKDAKAVKPAPATSGTEPSVKPAALAPAKAATDTAKPASATGTPAVKPAAEPKAN
jgi:hypothetical protein